MGGEVTIQEIKNQMEQAGSKPFDENSNYYGFKPSYPVYPDSPVCPHCGRCPVCGRPYHFQPYITW